MPSPNFIGLRNDLPETEHRFSVVICDANGVVTYETEQNYSRAERTFIRSSLKPFQALASLQNITIALTDEELAIIIASHAGTAEQQQWVESVLKKAECTQADLLCGTHPPFDKALAEQMLCRDESPTAMHHNCSGKHAGMLLACECKGWDKTSYRLPSHPYQQYLLKLLQSLCASENFELATDGCGVPVYAMSLQSIATLYAHLVSLPEFSRIANVMANHPNLIGDNQRVDSLIMSVTEGRLLAKVGADGLLGVSHRESRLGCAIKLWDGQNTLRDKVALVVLEKLGWLTSSEVETLKQKRPNLSLSRLNNQQEEIGTYQVL